MESKLQGIYNNYFRESKIKFSKANLGETTFIKLYLAKDETEEAHGYYDNDMIKCLFRLKEQENNYILESIINCYFIKPQEDYLCYSQKTVSFRKTTGDEKKILSSFEKFVKRLHDSILEDEKNGLIHDNFKDLVKSRVRKD